MIAPHSSLATVAEAPAAAARHGAQLSARPFVIQAGDTTRRHVIEPVA